MTEQQELKKPNGLKIASLTLAAAAIGLVIAVLVVANSTITLGNDVDCGSWISRDYWDAQNKDAVSSLLGREGTTVEACDSAADRKVPTLALLGGGALIAAIGSGFLFVGSSRRD